MKIKDIKNKIVLGFKSWFYTTLTEENIDKILKRKEQELEDIQVLEEQELERIREEMHEELGSTFTYDEIENMYRKVIGD